MSYQFDTEPRSVGAGIQPRPSQAHRHVAPLPKATFDHFPQALVAQLRQGYKTGLDHVKGENESLKKQIAALQMQVSVTATDKIWVEGCMHMYAQWEESVDIKVALEMSACNVTEGTMSVLRHSMGCQLRSETAMGEGQDMASDRWIKRPVSDDPRLAGVMCPTLPGAAAIRAERRALLQRHGVHATSGNKGAVVDCRKLMRDIVNEIHTPGCIKPWRDADDCAHVQVLGDAVTPLRTMTITNVCARSFDARAEMYPSFQALHSA